MTVEQHERGAHRSSGSPASVIDLDVVESPHASSLGTAEGFAVDTSAGPSADEMCALVRGLIVGGASHDDVRVELVERFGHRDEMLGRASALADERFLRGGDWTWYETSQAFLALLGPGAFYPRC